MSFTSGTCASGSTMQNIVLSLPAPLANAASIMPLSTSANDASLSRAKKATAATAKGITTASVPILVPTTKADSGSRKMSRIKNGMERTTFTVAPSTLLSKGLFMNRCVLEA